MSRYTGRDIDRYRESIHLMRKVSRLLSIRQLTTTPFHTICNGMVESFNGSLKLILKRFVLNGLKIGIDTSGQWFSPIVKSYRRVEGFHPASNFMGGH